MWVRIEAVTSETIELGNGVIGYRVHFVAGELQGQAWFASSAGPPAFEDYLTETGLQAAQDLRIATQTSDGVHGLTPLPTHGDYQVRGLVEAVWCDGDEKRIGGIYLRAGGWSFMLGDNDLSTKDFVTLSMLAVGDVIEFVAIGLSLWAYQI